MDIRQDRMYTKEHEWVRLEDGVALIGISDHAQEAMGAIVFVELPAEGKQIALGATLAVVESVKAASDVYSPVAGKVVRVNRSLDQTPELLNEAPYEQFIAALAPEGGILPGGLMTPDEYAAFVAANG